MSRTVSLEVGMCDAKSSFVLFFFFFVLLSFLARLNDLSRFCRALKGYVELRSQQRRERKPKLYNSAMVQTLDKLKIDLTVTVANQSGLNPGKSMEIENFGQRGGGRSRRNPVEEIHEYASSLGYLLPHLSALTELVIVADNYNRVSGPAQYAASTHKLQHLNTLRLEKVTVGTVGYFLSMVPSTRVLEEDEDGPILKEIKEFHLYLSDIVEHHSGKGKGKVTDDQGGGEPPLNMYANLAPAFPITKLSTSSTPMILVRLLIKHKVVYRYTDTLEIMLWSHGSERTNPVSARDAVWALMKTMGENATNIRLMPPESMVECEDWYGNPVSWYGRTRLSIPNCKSLLLEVNEKGYYPLEPLHTLLDLSPERTCSELNICLQSYPWSAKKYYAKSVAELSENSKVKVIIQCKTEERQACDNPTFGIREQ